MKERKKRLKRVSLLCKFLYLFWFFFFHIIPSTISCCRNSETLFDRKYRKVCFTLYIFSVSSGSSFNMMWNVQCNITCVNQKASNIFFFYVSFVDLLYVPSFVRGDRSNKMAVLEPRRSVGRPRVSQGGGMNILIYRSEDQHANHTRGLNFTS